MNGGFDPNKPCHFQKECNENFQLLISKLLVQTQVSCSGQHKIAENALFWAI